MIIGQAIPVAEIIEMEMGVMQEQIIEMEITEMHRLQEIQTTITIEILKNDFKI
jgi:hypothetical protein